MNPILAYIDKYRLLVYLIVFTALVYFSGNVAIELSAQLHPSVRTIVIEKRYENKDIHIHRETVYLPGGITKTTETLTDKTKTSSEAASTKDQKPMLAGGTAGDVRLFLGAGRNTDDRWHASASGLFGPVLITAQTDVYSSAKGGYPDNPDHRITAAVDILPLFR